jgi:predicted Holliday junction resolvase-like endonuclease
MIEIQTYVLLVVCISLVIILLKNRFWMALQIADTVDKAKEHFEEILNSERSENLLRTEEIHLRHSQEMIKKLSELRMKMDQSIRDLSESHKKALEEARVSSRRQTKAVRFGNAAQHSLLPLMAAQEEGIDPRDIRWLGGVFDFVVFKNLHKSENVPVEIIFADAKTSVRISKIINSNDVVGKYKKNDPAYTFFSTDQKRVAKAIERNKISYQLWMADSNTEEFQVRTYSSSSPSRHFGSYNKEKSNEAKTEEDPSKPV